MAAFNQYEYQNKERDRKYDRMELIVPKGKKAIIQQRAAELGLFNKRNQPNANEYILRLIDEDLNRQQAAGATDTDPLKGAMNPPEE